jgi:hypothetical protein
MTDISVLEVFDQSLIEQVGAFLPEEESEELLKHLQVMLQAELNQAGESGDIVSSAVYIAATSFVAGRTYAILNDSLDTFPVLMSREELQDYHEFLRERSQK